MAFIGKFPLSSGREDVYTGVRYLVLRGDLCNGRHRNLKKFA
jgi:hypothetical protein